MLEFPFCLLLIFRFYFSVQNFRLRVVKFLLFVFQPEEQIFGSHFSFFKKSFRFTVHRGFLLCVIHVAAIDFHR